MSSKRGSTKGSTQNTEFSFTDVTYVDGSYKSGGRKVVTENGFTAGSTMPMGDHPSSCTIENFRPNCWTYCESSSFSLRTGPNYKRTGKKSPSPKAFYEIIGVDFIRCEKRIDNIGSKLKIPEDWLYPKEVIEPLGMPSLFIVNVQLPENFKTSFFSTAEDDGVGWSLAIYFRASEEAILALQAEAEGRNTEPVPNALKLLQRYLREAPTAYETLGTSTKNCWNGRFKITIRLENIDEFGLPSFITSYNAKPVLIRNTGTLIRGKDYVEMDINVHKFSSLPKQALATMFDRFDRMLISIGFCIESIEDEEMPETLLGTVTLLKPTHPMTPLFQPNASSTSLPATQESERA